MKTLLLRLACVNGAADLQADLCNAFECRGATVCWNREQHSCCCWPLHKDCMALHLLFFAQGLRIVIGVRQCCS